MPFHAVGSLCSDFLNNLHINMEAQLKGIIHMLVLCGIICCNIPSGKFVAPVEAGASLDSLCYLVTVSNSLSNSFLFRE
jgi:hypothetical protein